MQSKHREQRLARELRARGASLRAIARELDVALSSVSVWVRDVRSRPELLRASGATPISELALQPLPVWTTGAVRRCYRCKRVLPEVAFGRATGSRQYRCRSCTREYLAERGDLHRRQSGEARDRRRLRAKAHVLQHLRSHACVDCGETDPVVLEFDHLGDKVSAVSVLAHDGMSPARLDQEIALCDVVCVCCHRKRTRARRAGADRTPPDLTRNAAYVRSILSAACCADCGIRDASVLEFDHIGAKAAAVSHLLYRGTSITRLKREVDQCEIVCGNCHRRRTAARGLHFRFRSAQQGA